MNAKSMQIVAATALVVTIVSGVSLAAQDKYTLRVPDGLAFSDFKGYEDWQLISSAKTGDRMKAFRATGSRFPTGPGSQRSSGNRSRARKRRLP